VESTVFVVFNERRRRSARGERRGDDRGRVRVKCSRRGFLRGSTTLWLTRLTAKSLLLASDRCPWVNTHPFLWLARSPHILVFKGFLANKFSFKWKSCSSSLCAGHVCPLFWNFPRLRFGSNIFIMPLSVWVTICVCVYYAVMNDNKCYSLYAAKCS